MLQRRAAVLDEPVPVAAAGQLDRGGAGPDEGDVVDRGALRVPAPGPGVDLLRHAGEPADHQMGADRTTVLGEAHGAEELDALGVRNVGSIGPEALEVGRDLPEQLGLKLAEWD